MYKAFILGDLGTDSYTMGNGVEDHVLDFLFIVSTFMLQINLLNLLIGVMGNTYAARSEAAEKISMDEFKCERIRR